MKHVRIGILFLLTALLVCFALGAQAAPEVPEGAVEVEEGLWHYVEESGAKLGVYHTKYPEVTGLTIEENGKALKPGDTVHFRVKTKAYDGATIEYIYMDFGRNQSYDRRVDLELDEETGEYVGEYTFLEADRGGEYYVTYLSIHDNYDFYTTYSSRSKRVMQRLLPGTVILQNPDRVASNPISNVVFEEKGQTLKPGDTLHLSFDMPKDLKLSSLYVSFYRQNGGRSISMNYYPEETQYRTNPGNFTYDAATGHVTLDYVLKEEHYNGKYYLGYIHEYDQDDYDFYRSFDSTLFPFTLTGATDPVEEDEEAEKTLNVEDVQSPENATTVIDGETVHVTFKVTGTAEVNYAYIYLRLFDPDDNVYGSGVNTYSSYRIRVDAELAAGSTNLYEAVYTMKDTDLYGVYSVEVTVDGEIYRNVESDLMFNFAKTKEETLKRLEPATNLRWTDDHRACYKLPADHQGRVTVRLWRNGSTSWSRGWTYFFEKDDGDWTDTSGENFFSGWSSELETGDYYFTVTMRGDGKNYYDSVTAKSDLLHYTKPDKRLGTPFQPVWVDKEGAYGGKALTVHMSGDLTDLDEYECYWYYAETEDEEPVSCGWASGDWVANDDDKSVGTFELFDEILQEYGSGYYYGKVKAHCDDAWVCLSGEYSELSKGQYFGAGSGGEGEESVLEKLEDVVTADKTPDEIREQVQSIGTDELRVAMVTDDSTAEALRNLEVAAGVTTQVTATADAPAEIAEGVTTVGAGLNTLTGEQPTLVIDKPKQDDVLPAQFDNALAIRFSMELENVADPDNLKVPVMIDLPIPESINPAYLVLLHYHLTTNEPEYILPYVYQAGNKWYAQFVLTRFSDFIMVESPTQTDEKTQKITDFVTRCYSLILNRDPDATGLADWVGKLKEKTNTAAEIIYGFMYSPEYTNRNLGNEKTVEILYRTMLDREPDAGGKADWLNRLANGAEIKDIINGFCGSPEFLKLCDSYGIVAGAVTPPLPENSKQIQAFVSRCYSLILNRDPDALGFADWVIQLANKTKNASEIIYGFMYSAEYTSRGLSNEKTVEILYNTMLNRASDAAGKADWLNRLANGATIVDIINGFCGSPEFNALCAEYGIEPGRVATGGAKVVKTAAAQPAANEPAAEPVKNNGYLAFVSRCYQIALGREASEVELNGWAAQETNLKQAAKAILFSDEAQAKLAANEEFVKALYRLYCGREADAEGLAFWTEKLNAGESREAVVSVFEASDEFKAVLKGLKEKK